MTIQGRRGSDPDGSLSSTARVYGDAMAEVEVTLADGTSEHYQNANPYESHYPVLHPDRSLTVNRMDQPGDGSPPAFDEVVARYGPEQFIGFTEHS